MFGNHIIADIIAYHCANVDLLCRQELCNGILVSERDYVTALSTRIRDKLNNSLFVSCHAQTVVPKVENENGVDGIMIFKWLNHIKVGLYEAKRPQVTKNNYAWDCLTTRNTSHFSEQIEKQHKWLDTFALWEMFFNEGQVGYSSPPFDYFGSSCVWHCNAYTFMNTHGLIFSPWTSAKLKVLLNYSCTNFYSIVYDIISCKAGKQFMVDNDSQTARITSNTNSELFTSIPLPLNAGGENDERIEKYMIANGLTSYTYINLDNMSSITI